MDPRWPTVLPTDEQDRRAWLRYWLPALPAKVARGARDNLVRFKGLSDEQVDRLLSVFALREIDSVWNDRKRGEPVRLRRWLRDVLPIDVELLPGSHAVLRSPGAGYRVEIQWLQSGRDNRRKPILQPKLLRVVGEGDAFALPDLWVYFAAYFVRLGGLPGEREFVRTALERPEPGQPPKRDFYRRLYDERDRLVAKGERAPAKVLGERLDVSPVTVRSWLKRARIYLKKGSE